MAMDVISLNKLNKQGFIANNAISCIIFTMLISIPVARRCDISAKLGNECVSVSHCSSHYILSG